MSKISTFFSVNLTHLQDETGKQIFPNLIGWSVRPFLSGEHRELLQAHIGLTEDERREKQHEYNVVVLSKIAVKAPANLPDFPEKYENLETAIYDYLIEKTEANELLAEFSMIEHLQTIGGKYFFR